MSPTIDAAASFRFRQKLPDLGSLPRRRIAIALKSSGAVVLTMDYPNCDDRCFRATKARRAAFCASSSSTGRFLSSAGDRADSVSNMRSLIAVFLPAFSPPPDLISREHMSAGPVGTHREVFFKPTFAFARAVRLLAQNIHPAIGRARTSTRWAIGPIRSCAAARGTPNRLRIMGELHVKSDKVLDPHEIPEFDAGAGTTNPVSRCELGKSCAA